MVRVTKLDAELCLKINSICSRLEIDCSQLIYDIELIQKIGFESWDKLPYNEHHIWIDTSERNSMELTSEGKKIIKSNTNEIVDQSLLFPLYKIEEDLFFEELPNHSLVFGEVVTGQLFKTSFTCESFQADKLSFKLIKPFQNFQNLNISQVLYDGLKLESKASQFINRSFFAFINEKLD